MADITAPGPAETQGDDHNVYWSGVATPLGEWFLASTALGLGLLGTAGKEDFMARLAAKYPGHLLCCEPLANEDAGLMVVQYFAGARQDFGPHPPLLDLRGATDFDLLVWQETMQIPFGAVMGYGQVASRLGRGSARAVGNALGRNPVPLFIPCHRVITAAGTLGGYSGGAGVKLALLTREGFRVDSLGQVARR